MSVIVYVVTCHSSDPYADGDGSNELEGVFFTLELAKLHVKAGKPSSERRFTVVECPVDCAPERFKTVLVAPESKLR